jgi:hypothetical protein
VDIENKSADMVNLIIILKEGKGTDFKKNFFVIGMIK